MLDVWLVSLLALGYVGLLFGIARFADRRAEHLGKGAWEPLIYSLSLAVYCTAWSFYGSVGHAAWSGFGFALTCIGPVLMLLLGYPVLQKMLRTAKANDVTSIADFIGARYGKSHPVAALVTVVAVIGILPLIALQLQAVTITFNTLVAGPPPPGIATDTAPFWSDTAFHVTLAMALFAILFGLRRVHSNERHQGMMAAIAFESLVKLGAFIALGLFTLFVLFTGPTELAERAAAIPRFIDRLTTVRLQPHWFTISFLAALAFICLPRQFHVAVVECGKPANLRVAAWVFPLYLVAIALFVPAIAAAGVVSFEFGTRPELFALLLPMAPIIRC